MSVDDTVIVDMKAVGVGPGKYEVADYFNAEDWIALFKALGADVAAVKLDNDAGGVLNFWPKPESAGPILDEIRGRDNSAKYRAVVQQIARTVGFSIA